MKNISTKFSVMAIILIIIFCVAITPITLQNDTFYTIKIGEYISKNGITGVDPFSWHEGLTYTFPHWGYDFIMYQIYNIGGFEGIYIYTVILSCILGICIYAVNVKLNKNTVFSFIITLFAIYLLRNYIAARAQLVTFILFILEIFFIERFLETKKKIYGIFLIIISILIANLHVAVWPFFFILFMPYIGEYLCCYIIDAPKYFLKFKKKILKNNLEKIEEINSKIEAFEIKHEKRRKSPYKIIINKNKITKGLIIIFIICIFTGFLTPLGNTPFTYLPNTMKGNTTKNINEHLPLTLYENIEFMAVIVAFLGILMFTDTKIRLKDLFLISGLLYLSFMTRRQTSMFILLGSTVLVRLIQSFLEKYDKNITEAVQKLSITIIGKGLITSFILLLCINIIEPKINNKIVDSNNYPVEASDYIIENLDIEKMKLFNEYDYGSYLLFRGIPVFIDSRADLYTNEFNEGVNIFSDFLNISGIGVYYEDKFEEYGITHIIVKKKAKLNMLLEKDRNYLKLYSDDSFCIYERIKISNEQ